MAEVAVQHELEHSRRPAVVGRIRRFVNRHPLLIAGTILSVGWVVIAIWVPVIMRIDPIAQDSDIVLGPPFQGPRHPLGTDHLGRDMLARLVFGARVSLLIGWVSVVLGAGVGLLLGLLAAYYGSWPDNVLMRIAEAKMAFPFILLVLLLMSVVIPGPGIIIAVFAFVGWPVYAKVVRGIALSLKEEEYIMAAHALGAPDLWIMRRHFMPNLSPYLFVLIPLQLSQVVFAEAGLSFIGVGVQPPHPSWGAMLADSRNYMTTAWWLPVLPGLALLLTVLGANLLGDGLQEVLDPKRKVET